jgi:hypothetical protein
MASTVPSQPTTRPVSSAIRKEQAGRVWLEGVQGFSFGEKQCSTLAVQSEILRVLGEQMTYEDLVGGSGLAFRVQMYKASMCPSAPHTMVGFRCVSDAFRPCSFKVCEFGDPKSNDPTVQHRIAESRSAVKASIDAGIPVISVAEEDGLIIGYQKEGQEWLVLNPMHDGGHTPCVETGLPWCVAIADGRQPNILSPRETAIAAMKQAMAMWEGDSERYYVGQKAWQEWITRIDSITQHPETAGDSQHANAWMYDSLIAYRRTAANYLRKHAQHFGPSPAQHMRHSADLYDKLTNQILTDSTHSANAVAPYSSKDHPWTKEQRDDQVRRMREAMAIEAQALGELRKALDALQG